MNKIEGRQLDDMSVAVGRIEEYIRSNRHGVANLSMKVDGVGATISKEIAVMEAKLATRIEQLELRVSSLELSDAKDGGEKSVLVWIIQSPLITWLIALAAFVYAWVSAHAGGVHGRP